MGKVENAIFVMEREQINTQFQIHIVFVNGENEGKKRKRKRKRHKMNKDQSGENYNSSVAKLCLLEPNVDS